MTNGGATDDKTVHAALYTPACRARRRRAAPRGTSRNLTPPVSHSVSVDGYLFVFYGRHQPSPTALRTNTCLFLVFRHTQHLINLPPAALFVFQAGQCTLAGEELSPVTIDSLVLKKNTFKKRNNNKVYSAAVLLGFLSFPANLKNAESLSFRFSRLCRLFWFSLLLVL